MNSVASGDQHYALTYQLNVDDYRAMFAARQRSQKALRRRAIVWKILPVLAGVSAAFFWWRDGQIIDGVMAILLLTSPITMHYLKNYAYARHFDKQRLGASEIRLTGDSEGLCLQRAGGEMRVAWGSVQEVDADAGRVFIWMSAAHSVLVPRSAFASDDEAGAFADWVRSNVARAHEVQGGAG